MLRAQAQRFVDHQIGHQCADPGNGHIAVEAQHALERLEDAQGHEQHRDRHIEDQPHHPARMAVRQARKKIRPGERPGISIGHVDLDLRDDHEERGRGQYHRRRIEHIAEAGEVHLGRLDRPVDRNLDLQREKGEKGAAQHLEHAGHDPSGPGHQHRRPPLAPVERGLFGQKAQVIDLLADLHHQRKRHGCGRTEHQRIKAAAVRHAADQRREIAIGLGVLEQYRNEGQHGQTDPQRLRPQLQFRDDRDAVHHQRHHTERGDEIAHRQRPAEIHLQRERQDGGLERKKDEGEARIDQ